MKKPLPAALLWAGFLLPLVLAFWPFASWGQPMALLLRVVPALSAQALFCRAFRAPLLRALPLLLTGAFALWSTWLFLTSPHWANATFAGYMADCVSPFIACGCVLWAAARRHKP